MLAVSAGKEFKPICDKELIWEVLQSLADSLCLLKHTFVAFANKLATARELVNTIIPSIEYIAGANFESEHEDGLLFTTHQILAELSEKVKGGIRNN